MRGQRVRMTGQLLVYDSEVSNRSTGNDGEVDEQFWARAAAEQAAGLRNPEDGDDSERVSLLHHTA